MQFMKCTNDGMNKKFFRVSLNSLKCREKSILHLDILILFFNSHADCKPQK